MLLAQFAGKIAMKNFWIKLIRASPPLRSETLTHLSGLTLGLSRRAHNACPDKYST
jgi:hypothetical protein